MAQAWYDLPDSGHVNGWDRVIDALTQHPELVTALLDEARESLAEAEARTVKALLELRDKLATALDDMDPVPDGDADEARPRG